MTIPALTLIAVAGVLPVAPASPRHGVDPPAKERIETSARKIKELRKERLTTLKEQVDIFTELVVLPRERGDCFGEAVEATLLLLQAELEATEKGADRIELYQKAIARLKQYEKVANEQVQEGFGTRETSVRIIKARRLEVEIKSEQSRIKDTKRAAAASEGSKNGAKPPASEPIDGPAQKIKELQKERIATLQAVVDQTIADFRKARGKYEEVLKAQMLLVEAKLDAAEKGSERITLYNEAVERLKQYEKWAQEMVVAGRGTTATVLGLKARRLEVEIQLEQVKVKQVKEGK